MLAEVFAKKIIDQSTYEKFLMKQESNPHCSSAVLSGYLLLDIRKHLEEKAHLFDTFCECVEEIEHECAEELQGIIQYYNKVFGESLRIIIIITDDYKRHKPQQPSEEACSQEASDENCAHGGNTSDFGAEENTGLQVCN